MRHKAEYSSSHQIMTPGSWQCRAESVGDPLQRRPHMA